MQITLLSTLLLAASHALAAPQTPTDKVVQAFMALDTDGSDGVSQQEYLRMVEKRARQRFRQMDANRDGEVNEQEYRAFWQNQRAKWYRLRR
ncbi:MAG: thymidylate synthase [Zetaproteobacteria bacterium]|nr:MAG: thymidylate synthase [Zetaproteobacteria bacterium]